MKSFVREEYETEKFKKASGEVERGFRSAEKILVLNNPLMQIAFNMGMLLVSLFGTRLIVRRAAKRSESEIIPCCSYTACKCFPV